MAHTPQLIMTHLEHIAAHKAQQVGTDVSLFVMEQVEIHQML